MSYEEEQTKRAVAAIHPCRTFLHPRQGTPAGDSLGQYDAAPDSSRSSSPCGNRVAQVGPFSGYQQLQVFRQDFSARGIAQRRGTNAATFDWEIRIPTRE